MTVKPASRHLLIQVPITVRETEGVTMLVPHIRCVYMGTSYVAVVGVTLVFTVWYSFAIV